MCACMYARAWDRMCEHLVRSSDRTHTCRCPAYIIYIHTCKCTHIRTRQTKRLRHKLHIRTCIKLKGTHCVKRCCSGVLRCADRTPPIIYQHTSHTISSVCVCVWDTRPMWISERTYAVHAILAHFERATHRYSWWVRACHNTYFNAPIIKANTLGCHIRT